MLVVACLFVFCCLAIMLAKQASPISLADANPISQTVLSVQALSVQSLSVQSSTQESTEPPKTEEKSANESATKPKQNGDGETTAVEEKKPNSDSSLDKQATKSESDEPQETERQKELRAAAEKERKERGGTVKDLKTKLKEASRKDSNEALNLTFDDLVFEMKKTEDFKRKMLLPEHDQLNKRRVALSGYIRPSSKQSGITKFVFVRDNLECCFGPGAALFDCVLVKLEKGQSTDYTVRPVTIEGDFYIKEFIGPNGKVWAVYRMKNGRVK